MIWVMRVTWYALYVIRIDSEGLRIFVLGVIMDTS